MTFSAGRESDVSVFTMNGELTVANRQELKRAVLDAVANGDRKVLIDFEQTSYIDSSGLGVLVSLSKRIREAGGELRLATLNDDLGTLFELTRLDTLFSITESRSAGLADLAKL